MAVRLVDADAVNVLAVLMLEDNVTADVYAEAAARATGWADAAVARYGVACAQPTGFLWTRIRS